MIVGKLQTTTCCPYCTLKFAGFGGKRRSHDGNMRQTQPKCSAACKFYGAGCVISRNSWLPGECRHVLMPTVEMRCQQLATST
eukprot:scaffold39469_cov15-Prasinocladus_malaysianus.AAC.1